MRHDDTKTMSITRLRGSRLSARPFYTTVLILSVLTAYSFLAQTQLRHRPSRDDSYDGHALFKRSDEPECREVHKADDQCAFVRQYCLDDDAGLLSYLELYYCTLGNAKPLAFIVLVSWLGLLFTTIGIAASDFFSVNLSTIATILGLSESLAGVTFLAFGNGSPDVFSTFAAMSSNSPSMAVGELIGAASFITGVVAGSMALVREFRVDKKTYARDICFFIVAVAFTMVFLADGHLRYWECWAMIGYYIVYVVTVVTLHWYSTRRKRRQRREGEARSHFYGLVRQSGDELAGEPYRDDPNEVGRGPGQPSRSSTADRDMSALESGPRIEVDGREPDAYGEEDEEDIERDHERMVEAEVVRSMRVLRTGRTRRSTVNPIRPSLVGALEFRSALAQLQREGNLQLSSITGRSHSEDHLNRGRRGTTSAVPDPADPIRRTASGTLEDTAIRRDRALSSGNVPVSAGALPELMQARRSRGDSHLSLPQGTPAGQRTPSPVPSYTIHGNLAPPRQSGDQTDSAGHEREDEGLSPRLHLQIPSRRSSYSDRSSPSSPFPRYTDSPMLLTPNPHSERAEFLLPSPGLARRDSPYAGMQLPTEQPRPVRWWPYAALPPPHVLLATLFPTLQGWRDKTILDKILSTISVPSIFLLVVTLPVVESETSETGSDSDTIVEYSTPSGIGHAPPVSVEPQEIEPENEWERYRRRTASRSNSRPSLHSISPRRVSLAQEETAVASTSQIAAGPPPLATKAASDIPSISNANFEGAPWNRWLVCLQLFTGPMFAVFILWANISEDWEEPGKVLVKMLLYTLLGSLVLLGILVLFTSEDKRPKHHYILCFLGFIISIAWISTIAGEVVGVLKTFGVVLGISEGLLGLTIFAAGNSVGDLVADITVARLGYPVMALSACFGGPMLNILLGIGIGGVLMMVKKANRQHHKHPDRPVEYGPYRVQVGGTLMISAITLLVILVGLLIIVPMNKWMLTRKIGWVLIAMWVVSTIVNVVVEVTGVWGDVA